MLGCKQSKIDGGFLMKALVIGLTIFSCVITARSETFQMDRKGEATVEVQKSSGEYRVTCRFRPQTKFDKAINAKFNDAKGDSLCKKGLARYLKVATNETLAISGLYSVAPVKTSGGRLCYSFAVPVSGCEVMKVAVKPKPPSVPANPAVAAQVPVLATTNVAPEKEVQEVQPKTEMQPKTVTVTRSSSYVCVTKYKEVNGERTAISSTEYQGRNFKSPKEFDQFCEQEFSRIRALGDANLRAVRNLGK